MHQDLRFESYSMADEPQPAETETCIWLQCVHPYDPYLYNRLEV